MPLRPVTKKEKKQAEASIRNTIGSMTTICEHIREIFRIAESKVEREDVRNRILDECTIVFALAKRMNTKLLEYSKAGHES